jgi:hypothetical protein
MADDLFDLLIKVRDAAENVNGHAQAIIGEYRRKASFFSFEWAANSLVPHCRQGQKRAAARQWIVRQQHKIQRIREAKDRLRDGTHPALDLIRRAVGLRVPPIFVGDYSYPTAHEAAEALGEAVQAEWESAGGYDAVERAPDRMHAEYDFNNDADIAIEVSLEIFKRLRRLRKGRLPADLWGQIQQEFEAAWDRLEEEMATEGRRDRPDSRIDRGEANRRACEALKDPKLRSVRKLAKAIGCSEGLIAQLPAWRAYQDQLKKMDKSKAGGPKAIRLTDAVLASQGQDDPELERLIAEQRADDIAEQRQHRLRPKI